MRYANPLFELNAEERDTACEAADHIYEWVNQTPEQHRELVMGDVDYLAKIALKGVTQTQPRNQEAAQQYIARFAAWKINFFNNN
jgi:hypothetical protein